jgi:hypothetical protein
VDALAVRADEISTVGEDRIPAGAAADDVEASSASVEDVVARLPEEAVAPGPPVDPVGAVEAADARQPRAACRGSNTYALAGSAIASDRSRGSRTPGTTTNDTATRSAEVKIQKSMGIEPIQ